jgi:hypothetical protein
MIEVEIQRQNTDHVLHVSSVCRLLMMSGTVVDHATGS